MSGKFWTKPWSLVEGCTPVSEGCEHCWLKGREDRLYIPLRARKPQVYAIWSDLLHEQISTRQIDAALEVMDACPQHTFLLITKRAELIQEKLYKVTEDNPIRYLGGGDYIKNLWLIVTAENQARADERIPHLLQWPGKRGIIIEPMLGPVDLEVGLEEFQPLNPDLSRKPAPIHQVILGGETGPHARFMDIEWARTVRDDCAFMGVPFFFKGPGGRNKSRLLDGREHNDLAWDRP